AERANALRIPLRALRFNPEHKAESAEATPPPRGDGAKRSTPAVWVLQPDSSLRKVDVQVGVRNDQYAELTSGDVKEGDELAVAFQRQQSRAARQTSPLTGGPRFR